jgi:cell division protein FtsZ
LLEDASINGARGILINITGSGNLLLQEVHAASSIIQQAAHEDANIIFGAVLDEEMKERVKITVIATGFKPETIKSRRRPEEAVAVSAAAPRDAGGWNVSPFPAIPGPAARDNLEVPTFLRRRSEPRA